MEVLPELSFPERLKLIVDYVGSAEKMAKRARMSAKMVGKYLSGGSEPSRVRLIDLAIAGDVNTRWLAEGEGPAKRGTMEVPSGEDKTQVQLKRGEHDNPFSEEHKNGEIGQGFVQIPRYEVAASAGHGAIIHSEQIVDHLTFKADWVKNTLGIPVSSLALINVKGDSMEPTLSNGDVILIDMSRGGFDDNAVYVLRLNGTLLVKRVKRNFDGSVLVSSDNVMYPPDVIKDDVVETLNVVVRVVWCGRRM